MFLLVRHLSHHLLLIVFCLFYIYSISMHPSYILKLLSSLMAFSLRRAAPLQFCAHSQGSTKKAKCAIAGANQSTGRDTYHTDVNIYVCSYFVNYPRL